MKNNELGRSFRKIKEHISGIGRNAIQNALKPMYPELTDNLPASAGESPIPFIYSERQKRPELVAKFYGEYKSLRDHANSTNGQNPVHSVLYAAGETYRKYNRLAGYHRRFGLPEQLFIQGSESKVALEEDTRGLAIEILQAWILNAYRNKKNFSTAPFDHLLMSFVEIGTATGLSYEDLGIDIEIESEYRNTPPFDVIGVMIHGGGRGIVRIN